MVSGVPTLVDLRTADLFSATPLMLAAMGNQLAVIRLLLQHGADIALFDRSVRSALICSELKKTRFILKNYQFLDFLSF